jgi:dUTP pyrophosphatase
MVEGLVARLSVTFCFERNAMNLIDVKIKRLEGFKGALPTYETAGASGLDVRAQIESNIIVRPLERVLVPTKLSFEIPKGYEIQVRARSGWALKMGMAVLNGPGTIDADYRGEVKIILINLGSSDVEIKDQDRIAQMVLAPVMQARFIESDLLENSHRGEGGFGSTGF